VKHQIEQGSANWHKFRESRIGASDIPIIMGVSPYKTAYKLWAEKIGFDLQDAVTPAMLKGHEMEPSIRAYASAMHSMQFEPCVMTRDDFPWMMASLDGFHEEGETVTLLECKYNNRERHSELKKGNISESHQLQMQWQMYVAGAESCVYASCNQEDYETLVVQRNEALIEQCVNAAIEFKQMLDEARPPAMTERDKERIPIEEPEACKIAEQLKAKLQDIDVLKKQLKEEEEEKKRLMEMLTDYSDDGSFECGPIIMDRVSRKGAIDYQRFCKDHNIDSETLNAFRKPNVVFWQPKIKVADEN
jgi:putative phage-type endonuclease